MNPPADLLQRLEAAGQLHTVRWWDELDEAARKRLSAQLAAIDFGEVARLWRKAHADASQSSGGAAGGGDERAGRARPPAELVRLPKTEIERAAWNDAARRGCELMAQGRAAVILVAGGEGTRLRFPHPKGMYPIGPVTGRTLFEYLVPQVAVAAQRSGARIPFYVMTSDATHEKTEAEFAARGWFGLPPKDVFLFRQGTMPVVDLADGRLLMASKSEVAAGPDGHGGLVAALARAGLIDDMARRGVEHLFYVQVDNPAARVCDPAFLGFHVARGSELSTKVVAKRSAGERMGVLCDVDGSTQIIEYIGMPPDVAARTDAAGGLLHWAGNTAMHVISRSLLERLARGAAELPFHIARKHVPYVDEQGVRVEPKSFAPPNACKFEKFIFDALPLARNPLVLEADRGREFHPLKDLDGENNPESVRRGLTTLFTGWLRRAGVEVPVNTPVEISPLVALDESELVELGGARIESRLRRTPEGWVVE